MRPLLLLFLLLCVSCRERSQLHVQKLSHPIYPAEARDKNMQGIVRVDVSIGTNGKVLTAFAAGPETILTRAAVENARTWVYGPFPENYEFPIHHSIFYVYKLEGKTQFVIDPARVSTHLPDRVELVASPTASDYPVGRLK